MHEVQLYQFDKNFDERGQLYTSWKQDEIRFVQDKVSVSKYGTIRGFHGDFKTWKLITCLYGKFKLVTFNLFSRKKDVFTLDSTDKICYAVLVPPCVVNAHQCLSEECVLHYKWSCEYEGPESQISIYYNDYMIQPEWENTREKIVSKRDTEAQYYGEYLRSQTKCVGFL